MYAKVFKQMYTGTLATVGPWQALVTFQQLLILADADGIVDMTPEAISRQTTIPLEIIKTGLHALEQPDSDSRTPDEEGRRIVRLSDDRAWGWRITNYELYRKLRSEEDRREYHRQYWHKRKLNKLNSPSTNSTHEEEEGRGRGRVKNRSTPIPMSGEPDTVRLVFDHWKQTWDHPNAKLDPKRRRAIFGALKLGYTEDQLITAISGYKFSPHHCGQNERHTVYDDINLLLRDAAHIDAGLRFHEQPLPVPVSKPKPIRLWRPPADPPLLEKLP